MQIAHRVFLTISITRLLQVEDGIVSEGSNLSGVSARCAWEEGAESDWDDDDEDDDDDGEANPSFNEKLTPPKKNGNNNHVARNSKETSSLQQARSQPPPRPRPNQHHQNDSDPNEDISDSDEYDDEDDDDDDVPLGAEGVFPESDSEDETSDSIRYECVSVILSFYDSGVIEDVHMFIASSLHLPL